ncbi:MAG: single-stranded DNA-binding protein [Rhodospirillales bacterium]|nr:single-stranded DNA-binding protein [Rhodospirillales bacterium]
MYSINSVTIVGHLGADADIRTMQNGDKVATMSIATDHSYKDKQSGEWIKRTEWHRVVTFQKGLVSVLEKHARKGRLTAVQGMLRTRKWTDQSNIERYTTEIAVTPGCQIQFLEKLDDRGADDMPPNKDDDYSNYGGGADLDDDIPF